MAATYPKYMSLAVPDRDRGKLQLYTQPDSFAYSTDFTTSYNTNLTTGQETSFQAWATTYSLLGDLLDYDMRGYWLSTGGGVPSGHFPDTYKKPNHMTFSDQSIYNDSHAGHWYLGTFIAGATNLKYHTKQDLFDYFVANEPDTLLLFPFDVWTNAYTRYAYSSWIAQPTAYAMEDGTVIDTVYSFNPGKGIKDYLITDNFTKIDFNIIWTATSNDLYAEPWSKAYACLYTDATTKIANSDCYLAKLNTGGYPIVGSIPIMTTCENMNTSNQYTARFRSTRGVFSTRYIAPGTNSGQLLLITQKLDTLKLPNRIKGSTTLPGLIAYSTFMSGTNIDYNLTSGATKLDTVPSNGLIYSSGTPSIESNAINFPIRTNCASFLTPAGQVVRKQYDAKCGFGIIYKPYKPTLSVKSFTSPYTAQPSITLDTSNTDFGIVMNPVFTFAVRKLKRVPLCATVGHINTAGSCTIPDALADLYHSTVRKWVISDSYNISVAFSSRCIGAGYKIMWRASIIKANFPVIGVRLADVRWNETSNRCGLNVLRIAANAQAAMDQYTYAATGTTWMSGPVTFTNTTSEGESLLSPGSSFTLDVPYFSSIIQVHITVTFNAAGNMTICSATIDPLTDGTNETSRYGAYYVAN